MSEGVQRQASTYDLGAMRLSLLLRDDGVDLLLASLALDARKSHVRLG